MCLPLSFHIQFDSTETIVDSHWLVNGSAVIISAHFMWLFRWLFKRYIVREYIYLHGHISIKPPAEPEIDRHIESQKPTQQWDFIALCKCQRSWINSVGTPRRTFKSSVRSSGICMLNLRDTCIFEINSDQWVADLYKERPFSTEWSAGYKLILNHPHFITNPNWSKRTQFHGL